MKTFAISGRTPKSAGRQGGLVVVELAITLPLVILIMFATFELGRAFFQYTTLTKAVEAGTRYYASAVLNDAIDPVDAKNITKDLIVTASPDGSEAPILLDKNGSNGINIADANITFDGVHVRVSANYNFTPLLGAKLPIVGEMANFTMTATNTMRAL